MQPRLPYAGLNAILVIVSVALVCLAVSLVVFSFAFRLFSKKRLRLAALASVIVGIALGAANYGLIYLVQLPAFSRQLSQRIEDQKLASSLVKPGNRAPNFRINVDDGSELEIDHLRGKVVVLNFF